MKKFLFTSVVLLLPLVGKGQVTTTTVGECPVTKSITYQEAVDIALENAKREAVAQVCGTEVSTFSLIRTVNDDRDYTSRIMTNAYGVVRVLDKDVNYDGRYVKVTMTGEVYRVMVPRAITVSDLDNVCDVNEDLTFRVSFHKSSYLKIFWFDQDTGDGGILYDGNTGFDGSDYPIGFPINKWECYKKKICPFLMTQRDRMNEWSRTGVVPPSAPTPDATTKYVTILFVTTQHNVGFNGSKITEESFMDWWCNLPMSEREMPEKRTVAIKL